MEFIRSQAKYIGDQLKAMTISQKIAIGLLVVVLLGGMYQMSQWARGSDWTPLLDQSFTADQINRVQAELALSGVKSKVQGDRILVQGSDDDRRQMTAFLAQRGALPRDTSPGYAAIIKDNSVFVSNQEARWRQTRGLETELSGVLRHFQDVEDSHVFIEAPEKRGLGQAESCARASVYVKLRDGLPLDKKRVAAISNFVAGAVRGLDIKDVKITDGAQSYHAPLADSQIPNDMLDLQRSQEDYFTNKIYNQLNFIHGLVANVHAKLRDVDEQSHEEKLGQPITSKEMTKSEETGSKATAAAPGVRANTGRALTDAGAGSSSTKTEETSVMDGQRDIKRVDINKPAGFVDRYTASINVPHSYLEQIFRKKNADAGNREIKSEELEAIAGVEMPKIRDQVKSLIDAKADDQVVVTWYYDVPQPAAPMEAAASSPGVMVMVKEYGSQAGLALLGLFSLFVVWRIAKKAQTSVSGPAGSPVHAGVGARAGEAGMTSLGGGMVTVGEAEGMHSAMVGHEVDESLVRTQEIVDQISELVKEDPQSAAGILQTWLNNAA